MALLSLLLMLYVPTDRTEVTWSPPCLVDAIRYEPRGGNGGVVRHGVIVTPCWADVILFKHVVLELEFKP